MALNAGVGVLLFPALEDAQQLGLLFGRAGVESAAVRIHAADVAHVQRVRVVAGYAVARYRVVEQPVALAVGLNDDVIARILPAQLRVPVVQDAGLDRTFVRVRFWAGKPREEPLPLHQVISTHTLRHTGADLVLWGIHSDQNLKRAALGHTSGASVYGYDTLERYGPLFLKAYEQVGAPDFLHPEN